MKYLFVYCNDDGETRVLLLDHAEAVEWLIDRDCDLITEVPEADPCYWPEGAVYAAAITEPGFSL